MKQILVVLAFFIISNSFSQEFNINNLNEFCPGNSLASNHITDSSYGTTVINPKISLSSFETSGGIITEVSFWGTVDYINCSGTGRCDIDPLIFSIYFYAQDNGSVGELVDSFSNITVYRQETSIGLPLYPFYYYSISLPRPIFLTSGYVSLTEIPYYTGCQFAYRQSHHGNGEGYVSQLGFQEDNASIEDSEFPFSYCLIGTMDDCPIPCYVSKNYATTNSIEITWEGEGTEWEIKCVEAGQDTTGVASLVAFSKPYIITDLEPATYYDVYVRTICENNNSAWSNKKLFSTLCNESFIAPFIETFEDNSVSRPCWTQEIVDGNKEWVYANGSNNYLSNLGAFNGSKNARFRTYNAFFIETYVTKLISPIIDLSTITSPQLIFNYIQESDYDYVNPLKVYYKNGPSMDWTEFYSDITEKNQWYEKIINLPNPSPTYQLAFEGINNSGFDNCIDDVIIEGTTNIEVVNNDNISIYPNQNC